jgi:hypothetical protein
MALSGVLNWVNNNWPSKQSIAFYGASFAASAYTGFPSGNIDISLGRFLFRPKAEQKETREALISLLYPKNWAESNWSPTAILLYGHLWDLAGKTAAAANFYLTSDYSALASFATLLPTRWKTSAVATLLFQAAASPAINGHFLFLTPVAIKLAGTLLDVIRIKADIPFLEPWRDRVERIGQWVEALYFARLAVVAFGTAGQFYPILTYLGCSLMLRLMKQQFILHIFDSFAPWKDVIGLAMAAESGLGAFLLSCIQEPTFELNRWIELPSKVDAIEWGNLSSWQENFKQMDALPNLPQQLYDQLHQKLVERSEKFLDTIYGMLHNSDLHGISEGDLRRIYWNKGEAQKHSVNVHRFDLECIRFSLIFFMANLLRLRKQVANNIVTEEQYKKIEDLLYLQTLESIQGEISDKEIPLFDVGARLLTSYRAFHALRYVSDEGVSKFMQREGYSIWLRQMLQKTEQLDVSFPAGRLLISLAVGINYSLPNRAESNPRQVISEEMTTKYLALENRVTLTLAQLIAAVQTS